MLCVMAVYPNHKGSRFDIGYYATHHVVLARRLLEPLGLTGLRLMAGSTALDGTPPSFWAVAEMRFSNRAAFDDAMARCGAELFADGPNYTDVEPILQIASDVALPSSIQEH